MSNQHPLLPFTIGAFGYLVKYFAYNFLTPVVLITFAALMFVYITLVGPEIPFYKYISFLFPNDYRGNATIDEEDIMRAFNLLTFVFFIFSIVGGWLLRLFKRAKEQMLGSEEQIQAAGAAVPASRSWLATIKRRFIINSLAITVVYLVVFIAIPLAGFSEGTSPWQPYLIFIVFYVIAMVSDTIYIGIDSLSNAMLGWAMSNR